MRALRIPRSPLESTHCSDFLILHSLNHRCHHLRITFVVVGICMDDPSLGDEVVLKDAVRRIEPQQFQAATLFWKYDVCSVVKRNIGVAVLVNLFYILII
jgi:hypothetical protein